MNVSEKSNIILIGMPGAGKSTVGVVLAKRLGFQFYDTDLIIQAREHKRLQQIIDSKGLDYFRYTEEQVIANLQLEHCVIATGGSVVYYENGLKALAATGQLVYLQVDLPELEQRIADMGQRGLVMGEGQTFEQLYNERTPLYQKFADLTIPCQGCNAEQVAAAIEEQIKRQWPEFLHD